MILMWNNLLMRIIMQIITLKIILLLKLKLINIIFSRENMHVRTQACTYNNVMALVGHPGLR